MGSSKVDLKLDDSPGASVEDGDKSEEQQQQSVVGRTGYDAQKLPDTGCNLSSHESASSLQVQNRSPDPGRRSFTPDESPEHSSHVVDKGETRSNSSLHHSILPPGQPRSLSPMPALAVTSHETLAGVDRLHDDSCLLLGMGPGFGNLHDPASSQDNISRSSESGKSVDGTVLQKFSHASARSEGSKSEKSSKSSEKKKKTSSWYNMLNPTYKSRSEDFKRLFKELPESERLIVDYSCALQKDILVHGRLYVSQSYICFYANIFRWETFVVVMCRDVTSMTKEKTARVIPNAIQICTDQEKHFFTSFGARDKTYLMLFRIWQNALLEQPISSQELWQWVHYSYGEELGLTSDDDDYVAPSATEDEPKNSGALFIPKEVGSMGKDSPGVTSPETDDNVGNHDMSIDSMASLDENCSSIPNDKASVPALPPSIAVESNSVMVVKPKPSEYPTDLSDTSDSDGQVDVSEMGCPCSMHEGKEVLNTVVPLPVDLVFTLVFSGAKFYHDLLAARKTFDVIESPWQLCPDSGNKMRQVTYTLTLNHSMAKTAQTTETQTLAKQSKSGQLYLVQSDVTNTGIPYSDTFAVKSVYCLTRVSNSRTRLRVHGFVQYKKSVWGLVKSLIEKSAIQGMTDYCTDLETALNKEAERVCQQSGFKKTRRRKRVKLEAGKQESRAETSRSLHTQTTARRIAGSLCVDPSSLGYTPDVVIKVILATLVLLLLLNTLLFYKLWSLEDQSLRAVNSPDMLDLPPESHQVLTSEEWMQLLRKQALLHQTETSRWREALGDVIKLIRLMESSLSDLKSSIENYGSTAALRSVTLAASPPRDTSPARPAAQAKE